MPIYDPTGHPALSEAARRLDPPALAVEADAAELLLVRGATALADTAFDVGSSEHSRAVLAVVYQVNFQVAGGVDAEVFRSRHRGGRKDEYRDATPLVSARARAILETLITLTADTTNWPIAGPLR